MFHLAGSIVFQGMREDYCPRISPDGRDTTGQLVWKCEGEVVSQFNGFRTVTTGRAYSPKTAWMDWVMNSVTPMLDRREVS